MATDVLVEVLKEVIQGNFHDLATVVAVVSVVHLNPISLTPLLISRVHWYRVSLHLLVLQGTKHVVDLCLTESVEVLLIVFEELPEVVGVDG